MRKIVILHEKDNVGTVTTFIRKGETIPYAVNGESKEVAVVEDIKLGHKIALTHMDPHAPIIKYGEVIGEADSEILKGSLVHIHNVQSLRGRGDRNGDTVKGAE